MTRSTPMYESDPAAWEAHLAEGNATQARKRAGADALIRDAAGRILLVNPNYKPGWDLPGGMAEANESPADCVHREVLEELGLDIRPARLLAAEWVPPHGPWDDMIAFVFDGGVLTPGAVAGMRLTDGELDGFEFCDAAEAGRRLRPRQRHRAQAALAALDGAAVYLQDGQPFGLSDA